MGVRLGNAGKVRRGYTPMAEINVTPLVDVMLVLLVVFMITAPLLSVGIPVELPEADAQMLPGSEEPVVVTIAADARLHLQESEVELKDLAPRLVAITEARGDQPSIVVKGDAQVQYALFVQVMNALQTAGFTKIALETRKPES
ncbi:MAG: biopolymer transporter ExbD [Roseitalea porphyridii]